MQFSKMHGLGNDFMVVDAVTQNVFFSPELIRRPADRHLGVGFDQLLVVEPPYDPDLDFHYRIFNADGSEVSQCGNGARCFARFVRLKGLTNKRDIRVSTANGRMVLRNGRRSGAGEHGRAQLRAVLCRSAPTKRKRPISCVPPSRQYCAAWCPWEIRTASSVLMMWIRQRWKLSAR